MDEILNLIESVSEDFPSYSTSRYRDDLLNIDNTSMIAWSIIFTFQNFS